MKKSPKGNPSSVETPSKNLLRLNLLTGDIPSLHPHTLPQKRSQCLGRCLFEGLTRLSPSGKYELAGAIDFTRSDCQTRYVFTLRPMTYSDGTQVTAHDYEAKWKQALHPQSPCARAHLFYLIKNAEKAKKGLIGLDAIGVKALDDSHLQVELNHPAPYFFELLALPLFAPFKQEGNDLLGSGPYVISSRQRNNFLILEANPLFWDAHRIEIKQIILSMIPNAMTALDLYKKGMLDWIGDPFSPLPEEVLSQEDNWEKNDVLQPFWIHLNTKHFPLSSSLIRRALNLAIERHLVTQHIYTGCKPMKTALPNQFSCLSASSSAPANANQLFDEGLKQLGFTRKTFPTLTLGCCSVARHKRLAEYLKERWEQVFGITIHIQVQEWNTFYRNLNEGEYEIGGCFKHSEYTDPLALLSWLGSSNNFPQWSHPQYNDLIEQIKHETNKSKRQAFIREAELILEKEMPVIGVFSLCQFYKHNPALNHVVFASSGMPQLSALSMPSAHRNTQ